MELSLLRMTFRDGKQVMSDTGPRAFVGNIEIKRCEGGYGLFDRNTGKRLQNGHVWRMPGYAMQSARCLDAQREAKVQP